MSSELGLEVDETRTPYTVLALQGELDVYSSPQLRDCLVNLLKQGHRKIVIDLDLVDFIDSAGLAVLVGGLKRIRSFDGELSIVSRQRNVLRVLEISGLTSVFRMAASVDEATGSVAEQQ